VYVWIWRHLPGNVATKALLSVLLFLVVAGLLLFAGFPAISDHIEIWNPAF
jgi:hypothetical protein